MSKYFIDFEFLEGTQKKWFGKTKPTIDLISIGIVCEDGREYYAISKDFNLKEAWNRYDEVVNKHYPFGPEYNRVYWIRDNVLKPIWIELSLKKDPKYTKEEIMYVWDKLTNSERYFRMKLLFQLFGKTNKQIAEEIKEFCKPVEGHIYLAGTDSYEQVNIGRPNTIVPAKYWTETIGKRTPPEFYGYYCDYDWVVFCWLFGKMIDLPKGFPMYCIDLKQTLDELQELENSSYQHELNCNNITINPLKVINNLLNYPKQTNEHNALADARWNYELYKFLNTL